MPVDTTSRKGTSRRVQRKLTDEEMKDIEMKRLRGELSCAECRRLKLRCDKQVPCGSCCRRGCESICPCGTLSAGQGTRYILADTSQLHQKIGDMSYRIRQLEDALESLQASTSDKRHPLLSEELLKIKQGPESVGPAGASPETDELESQKSEPLDALGTLTVGHEGEMNYFGRSAGSEMLMMAYEEWDSESDVSEELSSSIPPSLTAMPMPFPYTEPHSQTPSALASVPPTLEALETFLPERNRARYLCNSYIGHGSLFFRALKEDELLDKLMPDVYNGAFRRASDRLPPGSVELPHQPPGGGTSVEQYPASSHALATAFFIFALGALLDLGLPAYNSEAEHFFELGRIALGFRSMMYSPQINTIRAVSLMATYCSLAGKGYSRDNAWCGMSLASKLAQSIGLHRDSSQWKLDPAIVDLRRNLWWEVFAADISHSLALGRPPSIHPSFVDCEFPTDEEATLTDSGNFIHGFWRLKYIFAKDAFFAVIQTTLVAKSPSYDSILELDKRIGKIDFTDIMLHSNGRPEPGDKDFYSSSLSLRDFYASQYRSVTLVYLHRSFFAQAIIDHPKNPLLSPYAPSFLAVYRAASNVIKAAVYQFERCPEMAMRVWFLLAPLFSAAVTVGTIVSRSPHSTLAPNALLDLGRAVELFERSASTSQRAKIALIVLRKLKQQADRSYDKIQPTGSTSQERPCTTLPDELELFGGQTKVWMRKSHCSRRTDREVRTISTKCNPGAVPSPPSSDGRSALLGDLKLAPIRTDFASSVSAQRSPTKYASSQESGGCLPSSTAHHSFPPSAEPSAEELYPIFRQFMEFWKSNHGSTVTTRIDHVPTTSPQHQSYSEDMLTQWLDEGVDSSAVSGIVGVSSDMSTSSSQLHPPPGHAHPFDSFVWHQSSLPDFSNTGVPPLHPHAPSTSSGSSFTELGLSSDSAMDTGWLAFLAECDLMGDN